MATDPSKPEMKMEFDGAIIETIETSIDNMQSELAPLTNFILPGGHPVISLCHILRTVTRRAERRLVSLSKMGEDHTSINIFLNRLSDYFFVLARYLSKQLGVPEVLWRGLS